jgi:hypothetical protein
MQIAVGSGAAVLMAGPQVMFGASSTSAAATNPSWRLGGDLSVNRLGFGAMRLTGDGIWGLTARMRSGC